MRKFLLSIISLALVGILFAQESPSYIKKPTLAVHGGFYDFKTAQKLRSSSLDAVINNKQWSKMDEMDVALGISFIKGISEHLDYSVNLFSGNARYLVRNRPDIVKDGFLHELDASFHLKLFSDKHIVVPYLSAGIGGSLWKGRFESFAPLGAGLQFRLVPDYFVFSNFQYRIPITQEANYHFLYTIGVAGPLTKDKPAPAPKELPPPPPPPPPPAPADTDKDGINDDVDKCPTVPGVAKYNGCPVPDTDKDGVNDEMDKCPTVPGLAKYNGCPIPDTDGDGINDEQDKCPTVPGLAKYNGCPIPDTDGDGINDEEDKCPTVPGIIELRGCPRPEFKAHQVLFATNSSTLIAGGKQELDKLSDYLTEYKDLNIMISGHTDATGPEAFNQKLSEKRALAAKAYLESKGIDAARMTTSGFGSSKPVADNKTSAGRKQNRRVEFSISD